MTDFDNIYALVQEINREWDRAVTAIRTRGHRPQSRIELRNVQIVDGYDGTRSILTHRRYPGPVRITFSEQS